MAATATAAPGVGRRSRRFLNQEAVEGYVCILPWLLGFCAFVAGPMIAALAISFTHWSLLAPPEWIGLENYERLVKDPMFYTAMWNTVYISFIAVPCQLILALLIAMALNQQLAGLTIYRTIFYLPSQMPIVASSLLWMWVFNPDYGLANAMLYLVGLPGLGWIFDPNLSKPSIILITLWGGVGTPLIIFLAGLQSVPDSLYEAADIDGAGPVQRFRNITLPLLSPIIFFNLIIGIIASFQAYFTLVFVTTQGGPANSTTIMILYIFYKAFRDFEMSYASALAWVLFLFVLALTATNFLLARWWVHYEGGDAA
ncbi:MAG: sugar ABC transporter permease [Chloroflexi bacterium]|nr:sugar ABC transporter permease [Chloroflexota bacterium]